MKINMKQIIVEETIKLLSEEPRMGQTMSDERHDIESDALIAAGLALEQGDLHTAVAKILEAIKRLNPVDTGEENLDQWQGKEIPPPGHPAFEEEPP